MGKHTNEDILASFEECYSGHKFRNQDLGGSIFDGLKTQFSEARIYRF